MMCILYPANMRFGTPTVQLVEFETKKKPATEGFTRKWETPQRTRRKGMSDDYVAFPPPTEGCGCRLHPGASQ